MERETFESTSKGTFGCEQLALKLRHSLSVSELLWTHDEEERSPHETSRTDSHKLWGKFKLNGPPSFQSVRKYLTKTTSNHRKRINNSLSAVKSSLRRKYFQPAPVRKAQPEENRRLEEDKNDPNKRWKEWGPYLSERQWGTVREDYSNDGSW